MNPNSIDLELLERLVNTPGLPGRETQVADIIRTSLPASNWQIHSDRLGNLVAHLPGNGPRVMLMAHMDEVGLIVRRITPDGFLLVERLGGMGVQALPGSRLTLWTQNGDLPAQVGLLPQHLSAQSNPTIVDMYVDIGVTSVEEALSLGVQIGDGLTWDSSFQKLGKDRISAKTLDDRLGCLVLLDLAHQIQENQPSCDLFLAFVVQEETMLMGGLPVVQAVLPEIVIGIDGTLAFDTPDLKDAQSDLRLGYGPALKWMDAIRGKQVAYVPSYRLASLVRTIAQDNQIPLQSEVVVGLSTALSPIPYACSGVETIALSIPIRYHHSAIETVDLSDARNLVNLMALLLSHPLN
jgi:putative aminopeptidase